MAIEIKRPALDFEKDVAIGIDLPMGSFAGSRFQLNYMTLDQAVANAKNLLLTNHGERPMRPLWGCNLRRRLFDNSTDDFIDKIEEDIRFNFKNQLPYINIIGLSTLSSTANPNQITISLSISLVGNEFETRQLLVPLDNLEPE